jgi:hypothetical protein
MAINALYKKYFQKSKIFLYPLLDIKRGTSVVPTETYVSWGEFCSTEDMKLICVYHSRTDAEYINFEKNVLLKHSRLCDYVKADAVTSIFTFDFSDLSDDWDHFINGRYSKMDIKIKRRILDFFDSNSGNYFYVNSYLFPLTNHAVYAELLDVSIDLIKEVHELCDKPDFDKENLVLEVANLENIEKTVNL